MRLKRLHAVTISMFMVSFSLILFELGLTRIFGVVLFASFAHLALALALLGISAGALMQHLWPSLVPAEGLEKRLGLLSLAQGLSTIGAVLFAVTVPITKQFAEPPAHYAERSSIPADLVDPLYFLLMLPILAIPFVVAGLAFAGAFQRMKEHIGLLYGADLIGGAVGAVLFVPLLYTVSAPDTVFVVALASCISAAVLLWSASAVRAAGGAALCGALMLVLTLISLSGRELLPVRFSAGYSEDNITYTRWTPLTRLALHEDERGAYMLLDNSSASEVILTERRRAVKAREPNRSLVYRVKDPPQRVGIIAASAGPEVAVAQHFGYENIDAIDIAPEIGDVVAERFADSPVNPFLVGNTNRVLADGRAAILHADEPYDIIQMVHANLHSSAGQLANAWSPALLETREAFTTYFEHLSDDGMLSFGRGGKTRHLARSATAALEDMGVEDPARNIAYITGPATVILIKKSPFTEAEVQRIREVLKDMRGQELTLDPLRPNRRRIQNILYGGPPMTDDRPYADSPEKVREWMAQTFTNPLGLTGSVPAGAVLYHTLTLQILFVLLAGLGLIIVPLMRREPTGLTQIEGLGSGLLYVSCLGYGYLAVETVLVHELILFVGHPTYAITVVVLTMLLLSGIGSVFVQRVPPERLTSTLRIVLGVVIALGAVQGWVMPSLLNTFALGLPLGVRIGLTALVLAPLGFVMGMPFPLAMRVLRPEASGMVPWAWALNGWMSVVASLGTVLISRMLGYSMAFTVALVAYVLALALCGRLADIGVARPSPAPTR
jgi:hypothetical protein